VVHKDLIERGPWTVIMVGLIDKCRVREILCKGRKVQWQARSHSITMARIIVGIDFRRLRLCCYGARISLPHDVLI